MTKLDADFWFDCGSFGGVQTSADGHIIPIAKSKPFTPAMNPTAPIPSGGGHCLLTVWENGRIACKVEVDAGWSEHRPTRELWLVLFARPGNSTIEIAQALHAFAGQAITLAFKVMGPANRG